MGFGLRCSVSPVHFKCRALSSAVVLFTAGLKKGYFEILLLRPRSRGSHSSSRVRQAQLIRGLWGELHKLSSQDVASLRLAQQGLSSLSCQRGRRFPFILLVGPMALANSRCISHRNALPDTQPDSRPIIPGTGSVGHRLDRRLGNRKTASRHGKSFSRMDRPMPILTTNLSISNVIAVPGPPSMPLPRTALSGFL